MQRSRNSQFLVFLTRTTNDITQLQMVLTMGLQVITQGPIMAIWAITKIADKNGNWLLALLVAVAVIAILMLFLLIMVMPKATFDSNSDR